MRPNKPSYRVEIKKSGTPPNETYGWKICRNSDVLPLLRSQELFSLAWQQLLTQIGAGCSLSIPPLDFA